MVAGEHNTGSARQRVRARFEGHVQGVGFRYTTVEIAQEFAVTGYVCNEPDGSVTVVAEGVEGEVLAFLHRVRSSHVGRYIRREQLAWSPARNEFRGFDVGFGYGTD